MLVRDRGDSWQLVLQPDHADLSGQFAGAWGDGDGFAPPRPLESLVRRGGAPRRRLGRLGPAPALDRDGKRPRNFLDVPVPSHLAFYRA